ncbi:hypothetical protein ACS0TY_001336 [Phlomoides rotata]
MAETVPSKSEAKRERQPISVPFIWEEKPGMPKKDWIPTVRPTKPPSPAVKLVVSVPFGWEEKPGTPLPSFVQPPKEPAFVALQEHSSIIFSPPPKYSNHNFGNNNDQGDNEGDDGSSDTYSIETDESFTSAKSLLANGLISTTAIASAVPCLALTTIDHEQLQSPGSPASETESTSSYATGTTSLVGAPFLEWLFPLLVPSSGVPNKVGYLEMNPSHKEFLHETNSSQARRPLLTLGELIVMSRRRSCRRKVTKMHKQRSVVNKFCLILIPL